MKATKQYVPVVLFNVLYKLVLPFESVNKILKCNHLKEFKAKEQYFSMVVFLCFKGGSSY